MSSPPDTATSELLLAFANLRKPQQTNFLESLNGYLYASPRQRKLQVQAWLTAPSDAVSDESEANAQEPLSAGSDGQQAAEPTASPELHSPHANA